VGHPARGGPGQGGRGQPEHQDDPALHGQPDARRGFDLGNTAARLGHSGGGSTTLKHYADPVSKVDRARRCPPRATRAARRRWAGWLVSLSPGELAGTGRRDRRPCTRDCCRTGA